MALKVLFIRHGETNWNIEGRAQGFSDVELSKRGQEQGEAIVRALKDEPITAVYSSPLRRALNIARRIASDHDLAVKVDERLKEINHGEFEGLRFKALHEKYPDFLKAWRQSPSNLKMPGGESLSELQARAWSFVEDIIAELDDSDYAVVISHNLTIITILCRILGLSLDHFRRIRQDTGGRTLVEFGPNGPVIVTMNDTAYLSCRSEGL